MTPEQPGPVEVARSADPLGLDIFAGLVRRRGDVTDLVSQLLGRPVRPRVRGQHVIGRSESARSHGEN
jgi:hypothetical protein